MLTLWEMYHREQSGYVTIHEMAPKVDSGRIIDEQAVEIRYPSRLYDILLQKKALGGRRLAAILRGGVGSTRTMEEGRDKNRYFGWPSPGQVLAFAYRTRMPSR